jgi:hypothetical protein
VAKSVSPADAVLAGLRKAVEALPAMKPLTGAGGVFPRGPKGEELARLAVEEGFLASKEETIKGGKKPKTVVYGVLTEKGIRRVVDADSPKATLEALLPVVRAIGKQPDAPNAEAFRGELMKATEMCVAAIKQAFTKLEGEVVKALAPSAAHTVNPGAVLNALQNALERVEAHSLPVAASTTSTPSSTSAPPAPSASALDDAISAFVAAWAKEKTVGCQFDVLWNHLKERYPHLTIGEFQDALRKLYDTGRIRLGGWPRMLDDLPQPNLALLVSSKVMYYAQPAHAHV